MYSDLLQNFWAIFWRMQGQNGMKLGMLMYPDHLQIWLGFGLSQGTFLILVQFWKGSDVVVFTIIILAVIGKNSHDHGTIMSQAWIADYVFESKGGKSMSKKSGGLFPTPYIKFCQICHWFQGSH